MLGCYVLNKRYTFHVSNGISALSHACAHVRVHTHTHSRTSPGQNSEDSHAGKQGEVAWMTE